MSSSRNSRISPRASAAPRFRAEACPRLGWATTRSRDPHSVRFNIASVPSVEPSTTMITSYSAPTPSCPRSEGSVRFRIR